MNYSELIAQLKIQVGTLALAAATLVLVRARGSDGVS